MGGTASELRLLDEAWSAVVGDRRPCPPLEIDGARGDLPSALPAAPVADACVSAALLAAADLAQARSGASPGVRVERPVVADAVRSERFFRVAGEPAGAGFAALSRFWPTADGFVRTHANYPWHRAALLRALHLTEATDAADNDLVPTVAAAMGERDAAAVEDAVFAAGGVAVRVRGVDEWRAHPQGRAVAAEPLVGHERLDAGAARRRRSADRPAAGVRVLDLTRVIAGPVCTRYLAALGADVLRVDPVGHDDVPPGSYADTLLGKHSCALDLTARDGTARLHELLDSADVLVSGYRPGALDRFGLTDDALAERHPGLVVVRLAAWGHTGPWAQRRGFDSVVQAGIGVADTESADGVSPGALPCQLLDHGTGYLAAAAALDGLVRQQAEGGTHVRRLSLARTGEWLLRAPRPGTEETEPEPAPRAAADGHVVEVGPVTAVPPPGRLDGVALSWHRATRFLRDDARWP